MNKSLFAILALDGSVQFWTN